MSKLSFDELQQKAASTNQDELLTSVSGGTFGDCHCQYCDADTSTPGDGTAGAFLDLGNAIAHALGWHEQ